MLGGIGDVHGHADNIGYLGGAGGPNPHPQS